ncbi:hypothetical protein, partial [Frankia sp. CiP3]|uniref:hypothetical protein n=1 Tax=Frankia sp. CiP3 TaxID=2880971 RepID=UPI001EF6BDF4
MSRKKKQAAGAAVESPSASPQEPEPGPAERAAVDGIPAQYSRAESGPRPQLTVIVPTRNEAGNV